MPDWPIRRRVPTRPNSLHHEAMSLAVPTFLTLGAVAAGLGWRLRTERERAARAEEAAREARDEIRRVDLARDRLFASLSHELRGPLGAIIGYQELLAEGIYGELDPRSGEAVRRIGVSAHQLLTLIDTVLDVARIQSGPVETETGRVLCADLLAAVLDDASALAAERDVEIEREERAAVNPVIVTDPHRLPKALELAASAAIRASSGSRITASVEADADGSVRFSFRGTGIDPETPIRVAGSPGPTPELPTGDGGEAGRRGHGQAVMRLSLAAALVHFLGGRLTLDPESDATTTLSLSLPASPQRAH